MERNLVSTGTVPADKAARLRATMERFCLPDRPARPVPDLIAAVREYLMTGDRA